MSAKQSRGMKAMKNDFRKIFKNSLINMELQDKLTKYVSLDVQI